MGIGGVAEVADQGARLESKTPSEETLERAEMSKTRNLLIHSCLYFPSPVSLKFINC